MNAETSQLPALIGRIASVLATKPEYFVTHPTEVRLLQQLTDTDVRELARKHGWRTVRKVGGRQFQFYNDVTVRPIESGRNQPAV